MAEAQCFTAHQCDLENAKSTAAEAHLASLKLMDKNNVISQMFALPRNITLTKSHILLIH